MARAAKQRMSEFGDQNLANTAWAFATMHQSYEKLSTAMARALEQRISEFSIQNLRQRSMGICNYPLVV